MVASVPELTMRTSSIDGISSQILLREPRFDLRRRAERQAERGALLHGAHDRSDARGRGSSGPTSRRSRCSGGRRAPNTYAPLARSMNTGSPPTARNARTGEFTPPGM